MKRTVLVDFDGVIHSYTTPWQGARVIPDPPVPGAIEWLHRMVNDVRFEVCIYSSRSTQWAGKRAMRRWLKLWAPGRWNDEITTVSLGGHELQDLVSKHGLHNIQFPAKKPAAFLTIDDRAVCFDGTFPGPEQIADFRPWNKRGAS